MNDMRLAQHLAAKGRFGDTMLIHVNPAEVAGIASLFPNGLTINPETGLPEAFFFLPFLASMFGAAAPAAAAATAAAPALAAGAGTALAGIGAGTSAALGTLGTGITSALAAPVATAAEGIGALGTAASAAPAASSLLPALGTTAGPLGAPLAAAPLEVVTTTAANTVGAPAIDAITTGSTAAGGIGSLPIDTAATSLLPVPEAGTSIGVESLTGTPTIYTPASTGASMAGTEVAPVAEIAKPAVEAVKVVNPPTTNAGPFSAPGTGASVTPPPNTLLPKPGPYASVGEEGGGKGILGGIGDYLKKNPMMALGLGAQAFQSLGKMFAGSGKKKKSSKKLGSYKDLNGDPVFNDPTTAGRSEHNFFPNYDYNAYAARGGLVRGYANGGIVSLAGGGPVDLQAQMPQDMSFPLNGVPGGGGDEAPMLEDIPSSEFPTSQIGSEPEPPANPSDTVVGPTTNDHELIAQTVEAIQGKLADPRPVILAFVQEFGEPALQDLAMRVKGQGGQQGAGDGTSDSIPAKLSDGEFVVPADAVSHLGNGSTEAGGQQLQALVDNVRTAKTGSPGMPPPVDPTQGGIMSMMGGGLVRGYKKGGVVRRNPAVEDPKVMYSPNTVWADEVEMQGPDTWEVGPDEETVEYIEPPRRRMDLYRDPNMPLHVRPEIGQTQEWVDSMKQYQNALRFNAKIRGGGTVEEALKTRRN